MTNTITTFQRDNNCSMPDQIDSVADVPQVEDMSFLWELGKTDIERASLKKSIEGGHYNCLLVAVGDKQMFLPTAQAKHEGGHSFTRVPSSSELVRDQNNQLVYLPAVAGG